MGRKVHPIGFRLGINKPWLGRWYAEGSDYTEQLHQDLRIRELVLKGAERAGVSGIPVKGFQIHHEGSGSVGDIGHMDAAVGAAGEVPDHPGVDVAEEDFAFFSSFADAGNVVQNPFCFHTGEVGCQGQTNFGAVFVLTAFFGEFVADLVCTGILPDNGVVNWFAGGFFPYNCGFALVGDTDRGDFLDVDL